MDLTQLHHLYRKEKKVLISGITESLQDAELPGVIIWFKGCDAEPKCKNCQNPEVADLNWDTGFSIAFTDLTDYLTKLVDWVDYGIFSGGEPLMQKDAVIEIAKWFKEKKKLNFLYTWRGWEEVPEDIKELMDVVKCGRYVDELRDDSLRFRGSSNQYLMKKNKDGTWEKWEP
jgi:anaerobic ribonucleoside-triphosphate reductase activating protein